MSTTVEALPQIKTENVPVTPQTSLVPGALGQEVFCHYRLVIIF